MMGSSCSTRRRHRYQSDHHTTDGNHQHRRSDGNSRHRGTGRLRTRSFSSAVGRLCGASHVSLYAMHSHSICCLIRKPIAYHIEQLEHGH